MIKLVAFLGNPTKEYEKTRHNAGFIVADELFSHLQWSVKFHGAFAKEGGVMYVKPLTYMNASGTCVSEAASFFRIRPEEILVVHDDLELPLGCARFQQGGGLQGHNGLRSIRERMGSDRFWRLRIGIGRPVHGDVRVFVTSPFTKEEMVKLNQLTVRLKSVFSTFPTVQTDIKL